MERALRILTEKNVRITPMRQLVLEFFLYQQQTAGLSEMESVFPKADRITIYRTLKTFAENGILHTIDNGVAELKYALCPEHCSAEQHQDLHPHFHCIQCRQVTCLETVLIPSLNLPQDYTPAEVTMTIKGTCPSCQPQLLQ